MDLALELKLGTVEELKRRMTTHEFGWWVVYARKKMLPMRRLEVYLARIAQVTAGGALSDFLLKVDRPQDAQESATAATGYLANIGEGRVKYISRAKRRKR